MKGSTLARKARELGWTVSTANSGRVIWIRQIHGSSAADKSSYAHHIHIYCDDNGDVFNVVESKTEQVHRDSPLDASGFALNCIESGSLTIQH